MVDEREHMKRWVDHWKVAGEFLDQVKTEEMRGLTVERARKMSRTLLALSSNKRLYKDRSEISGLVEQQRYFSKWKR